MAAAAVIGCGEGGKPTASPAPAASPEAPAATSTPAAKQPKKGGTIVRPWAPQAVWAAGVDPHVIASDSDTTRMELFYQTLIRLNPRNEELEPLVAQRWEQRSPTEFVFTLAPGVKWQNKSPVNGRDLTANDVAFSLQRVGSPDRRFINRALLSAVDKVEAIDKSTLRVTLKEPAAVFSRTLTSPRLSVMAPEAVEKFGEKFISADTAIGTGPFLLQSYDDTGATLVRNPEYWRPGLPYLDGVKSPYFRDESAGWAAFLAGQLDIGIVPGTQAKKFTEEQSSKYYTEWFKVPVVTGYIFPFTGKKPFDDARVTRSLRLLVDHEEALVHAETWHGRGHHQTVLSPFLSSWDFTKEEYEARFLEFKKPKDEATKEALSLLSAAGFTKENPLRFELLGVPEPAYATARQELLQAQYKRLSQGVVNAQLKLVPIANGRTLVTNGEFDAAFLPILSGLATDPDFYFRSVFRSGSNLNYSRFSDPTADKAIDGQGKIFDLQQRKAAVKDLIAYLADHAPVTAWSGRSVLNAARPDIKNWTAEDTSWVWGAQYEQVWLDA